jgi:predicted O-methyltransferase YrrM
MELPKIPQAVIFRVLQQIKTLNPEDTYFDNYLWHYEKRGEDFYDTYHFAWQWAIAAKPKNILEIGVRTGISICQLLSAYIDYTIIERIVLCDVFNDGFISVGLVNYNLEKLQIAPHVVGKIKYLVGDSKNEIPKYHQENPDVKFDYILVDGSHEKMNAKIDLNNVVSMVADGGVIVFDDLGPDGCNLLDVWHEFKNEHEKNFEWCENLIGKGIGYAVKQTTGTTVAPVPIPPTGQPVIPPHIDLGAAS